MVFTDEGAPDTSGANTHLDGNALAGPLSEIFAVDVTAATSRCAHCGYTGPLACLHVYGHAPGLVARCQQCSQVALRLTHTRGIVWLDMQGIASLAIPVGDA
ncbi:DUF6510 family protein [Streptomyces kaempferi]|uniref:DUF6510 family protein n=1 Tax=Streptomyces kaempferi TaxID=333725 RepID=A0ABW3XUY2_9ACTN